MRFFVNGFITICFIFIAIAVNWLFINGAFFVVHHALVDRIHTGYMIFYSIALPLVNILMWELYLYAKIE